MTMQIKVAGYTSLKVATGRPLFVRNEMFDTFKRVYQESRTNYHMASILRTLMMLNADAIRGRSLNPAGDKRTLVCGHITLNYTLFDGAALINNLAIGTPQVNVTTGLYKVSYDKEDKEWIPEKNPIDVLSQDQQWKSKSGQAHYAAVSGKFDELSDASRRMPEHIIGAYKKEDFLTSSDRGNEYSLFYSQKGFHKSQAAAESLASIMQQSAKNGLPVNWLVHGEGFHTFKNAAKLIKAAPLASAAARGKDANAGKAQNQHVFFSNPSDSSSKDSLEALCTEAGLTFAGLNPNNRDLRRWSTLKNAGMEVGKAALAATASGSALTASGFVGASGGEKVMQNGINALVAGNYFMAAICVAGVAMIGMGIHKKLTPMAAGIKCTFGNGNERWYAGDKALLSQS